MWVFRVWKAEPAPASAGTACDGSKVKISARAGVPSDAILSSAAKAAPPIILAIFAPSGTGLPFDGIPARYALIIAGFPRMRATALTLRLIPIALYPVVLWVGATTADERVQIRALAHPAVLRARLAEVRERGKAAGDKRQEGELNRSCRCPAGMRRDPTHRVAGYGRRSVKTGYEDARSPACQTAA